MAFRVNLPDDGELELVDLGLSETSGRRGKASTIRRGGDGVMSSSGSSTLTGSFQGNYEEDEQTDELGDSSGGLKAFNWAQCESEVSCLLHFVKLFCATLSLTTRARANRAARKIARSVPTWEGRFPATRLLYSLTKKRRRLANQQKTFSTLRALMASSYRRESFGGLRMVGQVAAGP